MDFKRAVAAIEWRMGVASQGDGALQDWENLKTWLQADSGRMHELSATLADPLVEILRSGLFETQTELSPDLWNDLKKYLQDRRELRNWLLVRAAAYIQDHLNKEDSSLAGTANHGAPEVQSMNEEANPTTAPAVDSTTDQSQGSTNEMPSDKSPEATPISEESTEKDQSSVTNNSDETIEAKPVETVDTNPPSLSTQWKYLPVPDGPDKHDEFDARAGSSPENLKIIGARVRGKKHKHEGTNCDDWFEFLTAGTWTIIAVSDGAGSKVFSRVGALESCRAAAEELRACLAEHRLKERENWSNETFKRNKQTGVFAEDDLEHVQQALHSAMTKAYEAVVARAGELAGSAEHEAILGRKVEVDDLSGTLLLAVHTTVMHEGNERSFILTCQIGDGMLSALTTNGSLQLLGVPDSGEFAGQTDFLTSKKKLEKGSLTGRTFPFFGPLLALMVMTDGVADDYFPNDPGMMRLYGDLAINSILRLHPDPNLIDTSLAETDLKNTTGVSHAGLASPVEAITPDGPRQVFIRSVETYARKLGLPLEAVIVSTPLLFAGTITNPGDEMCTETNSEDRLRVWLDSYHVRGSFDDRTLVMLYREVPA